LQKKRTLQKTGKEGNSQTVDQLTKEKLKHDQFIDTTTHGIEWASAHRGSVLRTSGIVVGVLVVLIAIGVIWSKRSDAAAAAFGAAMQTDEAPLVTPGQPNDPGVKTYNSATERAQAANAKFLAVADKYGWTKDGKNALYFAGLTYLESGQTKSAEDTLKKVAGSWNGELAALAKEALADLYHQTGRDPQAIDLYNQLSDHPTDSVPAGLAQIQLAELYTDEGKTDLAHKIYATLEDKDKNSKGTPGPAAAIAKEKLNPTPAGGPQL
jgi:tetratricopeptide (TPR) repeat protein